MNGIAMTMQIGIVGKPNVGKSTFFNAVTHAHAEMASYPFTTIEANRGVMYVRSPCPCQDFKVTCHPKNSECREGVRYIPIEAIDVAGLVPQAHEGRGLGNKFLDDLRQASCLIHIVDASGSTDEEGKPCQVGEHDPRGDIAFLEKEIDYWIRGIIQKDWQRMARRCELEGEKIEELLGNKLTGLGIKIVEIHQAIKNLGCTAKMSNWGDKELLLLSTEIRKISKPMILALNKCDKVDPEEMKMLLNDFSMAIPTSAEGELALVHAAEKGLITYKPGESHFTITQKESLTEKQIKALEFLQTNILDRYGSTGVQECVEKAVFHLLRLIVVYPVEDSTHFTNKDGNVLPDAFLLPQGATALDLAYKIHSEIGDKFIRAVNARSNQIIGADYKLKDRDVIHIISK